MLLMSWIEAAGDLPSFMFLRAFRRKGILTIFLKLAPIKAFMPVRA